MDSEFLLKFIVYFPDYLLAFFGQPLSKQLYTAILHTKICNERFYVLQCVIENYEKECKLCTGFVHAQ